MTGHSHAGPIRVILRAPPHLPFLQSYPGIPAGGKHPVSSVEGTLEVRLRDPVKAKWIRVEVRKHESVPGTLTGKMGQQSTLHVGKVQELWKAADGKEFESIESTDYRFVVPLPEYLPPSVEIRGCSIRYELVAAVCYKGKGGLFKKDNSQYATVSEPLRITKYELASAWPVYNQVERKMVQADNGAVTLIVDRPSQAFGPGDRIVVTAAIKTTAASRPFRLKGFDMTLVEVLTIVPPPPPPTKKKNKPPPAPIVKRTSLCTTRAAMEANITPGIERGARLDLVVPSDRPLLTVRHAQEFKVEYELVVDAACEGGPGRVAGNGLTCIIGTFPRSSAQQAVKDIGYVPGLCPRGPPGVSGHQPHPSLAASLSATSLQHGPSPSPSPAPPRGQPSSPQQRANHLSPEPSAFYRPLSSYPTTPPQAQQQQLQQLSPQQYPQQQQQQQVRPPVPPVIGFVPRDPRDPNKWARRSSSGTTTTTATTATGLTDHGPLAERNVSTMPMGGSRGSLVFPSPNPSRHPQESPFGPMLEEREPRYESLPSRLQPRGGAGAQSELGHGAQQRMSAAPPSHPMWTPGQYDRVNDSSSPTTTMTDDTSQAAQTPTRPQSVNITPTRAQAPAQSQANRQSVGAPPEYTPPPRASTPVNSGTAQSIHSSPQSIRSGPSSPVAAVSAGSPASSRFPSSAQEKQQLRYMAAIAARDARSAPGAGPAGGTSNGSAVTSPDGAPGATAAPPPQPHPSEEPIPYDQIFPSGPSSAAAGSSQPPPAPAAAAKPYMSAEEEKDMMRKRYEEAQNKVARATGQQPSLNGHSPVTGVSPLTSPGSSVQGHGRAASQSHMTAAEEKEMMRRRYEEAQRGVARAAGAGDSPGAGPGPASQPLGSSSAAAGSTTAAPAPYMSAAEEKDMMRKRYEDAQRRVDQTQTVDAASVSSSPVAAQALAAPPPIDSPPPPPPAAESQAFLSAAEEKEMMRRRYEGAVNAVERNTGVGMSPTAGASSSSRVVSGGSVAAPPQPKQQSPVTTSPAYMSAAEEKEMMRRRYEGAVNAVERNTGVDIAPGAAAGSSSRVVSAGSSQPPQRQQSTPATSPAYMSAAEEKEMMRRRYEGAVNAVERATGADVASPVSPSARNVSSGSTNQPNYSAMTPEARYHLAKMRVDRAQTASPVTSSPAASPAAALQNSAAHSPSTTQSHSSRSPAAYMSAAEEKEMMRRRYEEAQGAVARAAGVGDSPGAGPSTTTATASARGPANSAPPPPADEPIPYDELFGPASSTSGPPGPSALSTPTAVSSPTTYMSAAEEKDMMRRRYEEAQHAVSRNMGGASGSNGGRAGSGVDGGGAGGAGSKSEPSWSPTDTAANTAPQPLSAEPKSAAPRFMSAEEEKEMMRKRFESAQAAVNNAASNAGGGGGAGQRPGIGTGASSGKSGTLPSPSSSSSSPTTTAAGGGAAAPGPPGRSRTMMSMSALPDGPPPPLAPRPPRDYVERLNRK